MGVGDKYIYYINYRIGKIDSTASAADYAPKAHHQAPPRECQRERRRHRRLSDFSDFSSGDMISTEDEEEDRG